MRKVYLVIKNIILCSLFFAILVNIFAFFAPLYRYEEDYLSTGTLDTFYAQDKGSVDVVFVGASSVYRFFVPTVLYKEHEITSMNFATAGMPAECMSGVINEVVEKQSPKLVVVELRDYIKWLDRDGQEEYEDETWDAKRESFISRLVNNMPPSLNRAKIIHDSVPSVLEQNELEWQFEYYKTHNNWENFNFYDYKEYIEKQLSGKKEVRNIEGKYKYEKYKGASVVSSVTYNETVDNSNNNEIREIAEENLTPLKNMVSAAKKCGTKVLFITTPYPESSERVGFENYIEKYLADEGLDFLNCNKLYKEIGIDFSSDFYDDKHVNTLGAYKVTDYFGNYLVENYNLEKTKLNENQQKEWQEASDLWYKEIYKPGVEKIKNTVKKNKEKGNTDY